MQGSGWSVLMGLVKWRSFVVVSWCWAHSEDDISFFTLRNEAEEGPNTRSIFRCCLMLIAQRFWMICIVGFGLSADSHLLRGIASHSWDRGHRDPGRNRCWADLSWWSFKIGLARLFLTVLLHFCPSKFHGRIILIILLNGWRFKGIEWLDGLLFNNF